MWSNHEARDDYRAVEFDLGDTRVIRCADDIQWIVQQRRNHAIKPWQARSYCATKDGLTAALARALGVSNLPEDAAAALEPLAPTCGQ